jgi:predicted  nucleic acid-binding Zn-ribbon protein
MLRKKILSLAVIASISMPLQVYAYDDLTQDNMLDDHQERIGNLESDTTDADAIGALNTRVVDIETSFLMPDEIRTRRDDAITLCDGQVENCSGDEYGLFGMGTLAQEKVAAELAEQSAVDAVEDASRALSDAENATDVDSVLVITLTQVKTDADAALDAAVVASDAVDARVTDRTTNDVASDVFDWHYANEVSNALGNLITDLDNEIAERETQELQGDAAALASQALTAAVTDQSDAQAAYDVDPNDQALEDALTEANADLAVAEQAYDDARATGTLFDVNELKQEAFDEASTAASAAFAEYSAAADVDPAGADTIAKLATYRSLLDDQNESSAELYTATVNVNNNSTDLAEASSSKGLVLIDKGSVDSSLPILNLDAVDSYLTMSTKLEADSVGYDSFKVDTQEDIDAATIVRDEKADQKVVTQNNLEQAQDDLISASNAFNDAQNAFDDANSEVVADPTNTVLLDALQVAQENLTDASKSFNAAYLDRDTAILLNANAGIALNDANGVLDDAVDRFNAADSIASQAEALFVADEEFKQNPDHIVQLRDAFVDGEDEGQAIINAAEANADGILLNEQAIADGDEANANDIFSLANEDADAGELGRVTVNEANISVNVTAIEANDDDIFSLANADADAGDLGRVTVNEAGIAANVDDISDNVTAIEANADGIFSLANDDADAGDLGRVTVNEAGIAANVADIDDLDGRVDVLEDEMDDVEGRLDVNEADIDTAEADIDTLEGEMDTAKDRLTANEGDIDTLEGEMDAAEGRLTVNEGDIVTLEGEMDAAEGRLTVNEGDIVTLEGEMDAAEGRLTVNEGDIDTAESDIDTLEVEMDAAEGRLTVNEGDIDTAEADIDTLEGEMDAAEGRLTVNEADIDTAEADIVTLEGEMDAAEGRLTVNATAIAGNDADIAANVTAIAGNDADIAANVTAIVNANTRIDTNVSDIAQNVSDIETNRNNIADNASNITKNKNAITDLENSMAVNVDMLKSGIASSLAIAGMPTLPGEGFGFSIGLGHFEGENATAMGISHVTSGRTVKLSVGHSNGNTSGSLGAAFRF